MPTISRLIFGAEDRAAAERFWRDALPVNAPVGVSVSNASTDGFRGFTLSLIAAQPGDVDALMSAGLDAGADLVKAAAKSLWGYGGVLRSPDGVLITYASASKKRLPSGSREVETFVLQLGVTDMGESKRFYEAHGFTASKSFGGSYAEFETGPVKLSLLKRAALAKTADVAAEGNGSSRLQIVADAEFIDPDGFEWTA